MTSFRDRPQPRPRQRVLGPWDSRAPDRVKRHGLSVAEQDAMLAAQHGRCAICQRPGLRLQVDHDHRVDAGRYGSRTSVRGLLCNKCNSGLGLIGDDNIPALIAYLTR